LSATEEALFDWATAMAPESALKECHGVPSNCVFIRPEAQAWQHARILAQMPDSVLRAFGRCGGASASPRPVDSNANGETGKHSSRDRVKDAANPRLGEPERRKGHRVGHNSGIRHLASGH